MLTYFTIEDYFGQFLDHPDMTQEVYENAEDLLRGMRRLRRCAGNWCEYSNTIASFSQT